MATKETIKATILDGIQTAVSPTVDSTNVVLANGDGSDDLPRVAYDVFGRTIDYNTGSKAAPSTYVLNGDHEVVDEVYDDYEELRVDIRAAAHDDGTRNALYEDIRRHFARYLLWLSPSDLHTDVESIDIGETQTLDETDTEPTRRIDQLSITVEYKRAIGRFDSQGTTGDPVRSVDHDLVDL